MIIRYNAGDVYSEYCIMLDENGTLLTPRDTYGNIYGISSVSGRNDSEFYAASGEAVIKVSDDEEFGYLPLVALMNDKGQQLTDFAYTSLTHYPGENIIVFSTDNNLLGAMDESGNILLPQKYISLVPNGQGGFLGSVCPEGGKYEYDKAYPLMYIDEKGRAFDTGYMAMPYGVYAFSEGFCSVTMNYEMDGASNVYLDFEGTNIFGKTYGWTESFYGNYAMIFDPTCGLYGLIDKTGAWALPPEYSTIDSGVYYDTGTYLACTETYAVLLDAYDLHEICRIDFADTGVNYAWLSGKDFISASGENITCIYSSDGAMITCGANADISYLYTDSRPERVVQIDGQWPDYTSTLKDLEGNTCGSPFQNLTPATWLNGQGRYIFSNYDFVTEADGQRYPDWATYRFGLCDENGNILLEPIYTSLDTLSPNRYWVRLGSRKGLIDDSGNWLYTIDDYEYLMD